VQAGEDDTRPANEGSLPPGVRLLVVDDNATARHIIVSMARSLGMQVDEAFDGWDAMRALTLAEKAGGAYDLVLLDWKMPGMDGVGCAHALQQGPRTSTVLMMTAFGRDEAMQALEERGVAVNAVLAKPVTPTSLYDACSAALGRAAGGADPGTRRKEPLQTQPPLRGLRVLLVEDNAINQELALELLGEAGMQVSVAEDGRQAMVALEDATFDVVLMDCQMPVMDGYEATRAIRRDTRWANLPIIAMTANAMVGDREKAIASGMNDHIAKPIQVAEMLATIGRWTTGRLDAGSNAQPG
jgi:CheY-like chemotaxis protein